MNPIARALIFIGIALVAIGFLWHFLSKAGIPFGKLPGDITIEKETFKFYFPIASSILASLVLSIALYFVRRFMK